MQVGIQVSLGLKLPLLKCMSAEQNKTLCWVQQYYQCYYDLQVPSEQSMIPAAEIPSVELPTLTVLSNLEIHLYPTGMHSTNVSTVLTDAGGKCSSRIQGDSGWY